ncbi:MAG: ABC transporter permease [Halanaerobiales bacterium]|nr:ABC transporter permease [Halanaerobiales bacterium]MCF8009420.1 ABC transporter permease [Halanaerobiales bacterium]
MKYNIFKIIMLSIFTIFAAFIILVLISPTLYIKSTNLLNLLINSKEVSFSLILSITTSLSAVFLAIIFGIPTAYVLSRYEFKFKRIIDIILDIPLVLPPIILGLSLLVLLGPIGGNQLAKLGLNFVFTKLGIVMAQFVVVAPLLIRSLKIAFSNVDPKLEKAAMTLGDNHFQVFKNITIPLSKEGIITGVTTAWARAMGEFGATVMLAGATRLKTETLPIAVYLNMTTGDLEMAVTVSIVMIIFSIIIMGILQIYNKNIYDYGGIRQ